MFPKIGFINTYGLMIFIGVLFAFLALKYQFKKREMDHKYLEVIESIAIFSVAIGIFMGALIQGVYSYIESPKEGFSLFHGITFLGGLLGGAGAFLLIYFIYYHKDIPNAFHRLCQILPFIGLCIPLAHAFGRIGCFLAGCCYGIETTSPLGVKFPGLSTPVYPTQLFESAFLFLLALLLFFLFQKKKEKWNMEIYVISYGVFRFFIEFIRGDDRGSFIPGLTPSQFWSICLLIGGLIALLIHLIRSHKKCAIN